MTAYLSLEFRRALRDRRYLGLVVGWPVAAYLLFSTVFGSAADRAEGLDAHVEIMVAMAAFGAMGAVLMATGPRLATERQSGWERQLRLTPLPASRALLARTGAALLLTLPAVCLTFAAAAGVKGVALPAWEWPAMVLLLLAGSVPFAALGLVIGNLADGDSAMGLTTVAYFALAALGGLWMPPKVLPSQMRAVAHVLPSNRLAELAWRVAAGHAPPLAAVGVLAAWAGVLGLGAVGLARRFSS
ncbi:MAG TPA: ABC transporter permease [Acidimicrobiales bacterium]|nr:ABC transporter permease [Acidimicrobiales bacterium]